MTAVLYSHPTLRAIFGVPDFRSGFVLIFPLFR
ncbi:MAG: hypothetical protein ACI88G_002015, partial [Woeseiaceae bacterium]